MQKTKQTNKQKNQYHQNTKTKLNNQTKTPEENVFTEVVMWARVDANYSCQSVLVSESSWTRFPLERTKVGGYVSFLFLFFFSSCLQVYQ
jgi:hypothetical protein